MKRLEGGIWGTADWSLDLIGRGIARFIPAKKSSEPDAALTGGAVVGTIFGTIIGFSLSEDSRVMTTLTGAVIGALLGICIGVAIAALVETVHDAIDDWIKSINSPESRRWK
jgi:hypothetical protein